MFMNTVAPPAAAYRPAALKTILAAGLIAGTTDICAAALQYIAKTGKNPVKILNYIASGVFGKERAYADDTWMPVSGLLLHYIIALIWAALFFLISPYISFLAKNRLLGSFIYGIFIWVVMNKVIVPLSATPPLPPGPFPYVSILIIIFCVALPIVVIVQRHYRLKQQ